MLHFAPKLVKVWEAICGPIGAPRCRFFGMSVELGGVGVRWIGCEVTGAVEDPANGSSDCRGSGGGGQGSAGLERFRRLLPTSLLRWMWMDVGGWG